MNNATAKAQVVEPGCNITWREAGPEIERREIKLEHLWFRQWRATCCEPGRMGFVDAVGDTALEAVENLLAQIGGANG